MITKWSFPDQLIRRIDKTFYHEVRVRRHFHGASTGIVKARKNDSAARVLARGEQAMRAEKQRRRKRAERNGNGSSGRPQSRVVR